MKLIKITWIVGNIRLTRVRFFVTSMSKLTIRNRVSDYKGCCHRIVFVFFFSAKAIFVLNSFIIFSKYFIYSNILKR